MTRPANMPAPNFQAYRANNPVVSSVQMSTKVTEFKPAAQPFTPNKILNVSTAPFVPSSRPAGGMNPGAGSFQPGVPAAPAKPV